MAHFCRICRRRRANERFTGRGHRQGICRDCQRRPKTERQRIEHFEELYAYLNQGNISARNQQRILLLCFDADPEVRQLAELLREIAQVHPRKRRRMISLARGHWPLFVRAVNLLGDEWWDSFLVDHADDHQLQELWDQARQEPHREALCPCGSGLTYWRCCAPRDEETFSQLRGALPSTTSRRSASLPEELDWHWTDPGLPNTWEAQPGFPV